MKYFAALLLLGLVSEAQATKEVAKQAQRLNVNAFVSESDSSDEDDSLVQWTDEFGTGETGIIDALTPPEGQCEERLWMHPKELDWQIDMFSRTFDEQYYRNAVKISTELKIAIPYIHAWELMDKAFSFPRVRRYDFVQNNMDLLNFVQDNLNMNKTNERNMQNFVRVGRTVLQNFRDKYHDGEFDAPANHDPRQEALDKYNNA